MVSDDVYQLTWKNGTGFVYDRGDVRRKPALQPCHRGVGARLDGQH
ncbi:MAG: hypothetical protein H6643_06490 [Caldilineaceae bacterium]|nr:hypothetical protein [Caldilineaceae bacterium]